MRKQMKTRLTLLLFIAVIFTSCEKDVMTFADDIYNLGRLANPSTEEYAFWATQSGKNTLAFTMDGKKIYQRRAHGYLFSGKGLAYFQIKDDQASIDIHADLKPEEFPFIDFSFPADQLEQGATIAPVIDFQYVYLPEIYERNSEGRIVKVREAEFRSFDMEETSMRFTHCEDKIISGFFTFVGSYTDSIGTVHRVNVTDGVFDVSDSIDF